MKTIGKFTEIKVKSRERLKTGLKISKTEKLRKE